MMIIGVLIIAWATVKAGEVSMDEPDELITTGPYAYSRNPMYVGWTLIFLGIIFIINSLYSLGLLMIVLIYTHCFVIRPEEVMLQKKFGEAYKAYKKNVRRYI